LHMHHGGAERRSRKAHVGVVCEAEAFLGDSDQVAVEFRIPVFIVNRGDGVIAGRKVFPNDRSLVLSGRDHRGSAPVGLLRVFRPSIRRREQDRADDTGGIPQAIDMDAQSAHGWGSALCRTVAGDG